MTTTTPPSAPTAVPSERIKQLIDEELRGLVRIRHDIHEHPELGYQEHRTSEVVCKALTDAGVEHRGGLAGGTGVLGVLPGKADRSTALRADMDALPIHEETGATYASTRPGVMHACGHDGHTTILIGAARVLSRIAREHPLPRPVSFVFQPAEEGGAGGRRMVEDGVLEGSVIGPPVEIIFGLHGWPTDPLGVVGTRVGPMLAAADMFSIELEGLGTHAASPHTGRDPIVAGAALVNALQTIASRNLDPLDALVVSVTQFHAGTTHNIIPERAQLTGTVRTLHAETQEMAIRRLHEISEAIAAAHQCKAEVEYEVGYPVTSNDAHAVGVFETVARRVVGDDHVKDMDAPVMGGEDFSFYGQRVPACFFKLGLLAPGQESMPMLHHPKFDFNDDAIRTGVQLFCELALRA